MTRDRHGAVRRRKAVTRLLARPPREARRPWWKWLVIGLLLGATVGVTAVYAITLATDIASRHWSSALDASREAVLVVVGWAAVFIVLSAGDDRDVAREDSGDSETRDSQDEPTAGTETVHQAQDHVRRLRVRFAELSEVRQRAGSGADPDLDRELATTSARLEQARQWLTSAQSARPTRVSDRHPAQRSAGKRRAAADKPQVGTADTPRPGSADKPRAGAANTSRPDSADKPRADAHLSRRPQVGTQLSQTAGRRPVIAQTAGRSARSNSPARVTFHRSRAARRAVYPI